ncbi:hypothetical protein BC828DRAFT_377169 [Blastocladiella britannica]|nr:hypothetical protein BC828DRAFT_377169 [Blastocladiella britannica]
MKKTASKRKNSSAQASLSSTSASSVLSSPSCLPAMPWPARGPRTPSSPPPPPFQPPPLPPMNSSSSPLTSARPLSVDSGFASHQLTTTPSYVSSSTLGRKSSAESLKSLPASPRRRPSALHRSLARKMRPLLAVFASIGTSSRSSSTSGSGAGVVMVNDGPGEQLSPPPTAAKRRQRERKQPPVAVVVPPTAVRSSSLTARASTLAAIRRASLSLVGGGNLLSPGNGGTSAASSSVEDPATVSATTPSAAIDEYIEQQQGQQKQQEQQTGGTGSRRGSSTSAGSIPRRLAKFERVHGDDRSDPAALSARMRLHISSAASEVLQRNYRKSPAATVVALYSASLVHGHGPLPPPPIPVSTFSAYMSDDEGPPPRPLVGGAEEGAALLSLREMLAHSSVPEVLLMPPPNTCAAAAAVLTSSPLQQHQHHQHWNDGAGRSRTSGHLPSPADSPSPVMVHTAACMCASPSCPSKAYDGTSPRPSKDERPRPVSIHLLHAALSLGEPRSGVDGKSPPIGQYGGKRNPGASTSGAGGGGSPSAAAPDASAHALRVAHMLVTHHLSAGVLTVVHSVPRFMLISVLARGRHLLPAHILTPSDRCMWSPGPIEVNPQLDLVRDAVTRATYQVVAVLRSARMRTPRHPMGDVGYVFQTLVQGIRLAAYVAACDPRLRWSWTPRGIPLPTSGDDHPLEEDSAPAASGREHLQLPPPPPPPPLMELVAPSDQSRVRALMPHRALFSVHPGIVRVTGHADDAWAVPVLQPGDAGHPGQLAEQVQGELWGTTTGGLPRPPGFARHHYRAMVVVAEQVVGEEISSDDDSPSGQAGGMDSPLTFPQYGGGAGAPDSAPLDHVFPPQPPAAADDPLPAMDDVDLDSDPRGSAATVVVPPFDLIAAANSLSIDTIAVAADADTGAATAAVQTARASEPATFASRSPAFVEPPPLPYIAATGSPVPTTSAANQVKLLADMLSRVQPSVASPPLHHQFRSRRSPSSLGMERTTTTGASPSSHSPFPLDAMAWPVGLVPGYDAGTYHAAARYSHASPTFVAAALAGNAATLLPATAYSGVHSPLAPAMSSSPSFTVPGSALSTSTTATVTLPRWDSGTFDDLRSPPASLSRSEVPPGGEEAKYSPSAMGTLDLPTVDAGGSLAGLGSSGRRANHLLRQALALEMLPANQTSYRGHSTSAGTTATGLQRSRSAVSSSSRSYASGMY